MRQISSPCPDRHPFMARTAVPGLAALLIVLALPAIAAASGAGFVQELIPGDSLDALTAPLFDANGGVHVLYTNGIGFYARRESDYWLTENTGVYNSLHAIAMDLDDQGDPHVIVAANGGLDYTERSGGSWTLPEILWVSLGVDDAALIVNGSDEVHLVYTGYGGELGYSVRSGGEWAHSIVDTNDARDVSMALDASGRPGIAYKSRDGIAYYTKCALLDTVWSIEVLDTTYASTPSNARKGTAIAFDSTGAPHIAAVGHSPAGLYHYVKSGTWMREAVDTFSNNTGEHSSMEIDATGAVHVSYKRDNDVAYVTNGSGSWEVCVIEPASLFGGLGLNSAGVPSLTYVNQAGKAVHALPFTYSASNMTLQARVGDYRYLNYSDCWGFVGTNAEEYAVIGQPNGVDIYRVTDPGAPVKVGATTGYWTLWHDAKDYVHPSGNHYLYVSGEGGAGIQIIDVTNPDLPVQLPTWGLAAISIHNIFIEQATGKLYVCASSTSSLNIYDILTDPENPTLLGSWNDEYVHDIYVRNDTVYASCFNAGEFRKLDATNPASMTTVLNFSWAGSAPHNAWPLESNLDFVLTTDENAGGHLRCWDISDPLNVTQVSTYQAGAPADIIHNVHVAGSVAYISYYLNGTHVVDFANPSTPVVLGWITPVPNTSDPFGGTWGVYPYLPSGTIVSSDRSNGLYLTTLDPVTVGVETAAGSPPRLFRLAPNRPNPFNPRTTIDFVAPGGAVELAVYDPAGRLVRTLVHGAPEKGVHSVVWDGHDNAGAAAGSGVYFYRLATGESVETRRMNLIR